MICFAGFGVEALCLFCLSFVFQVPAAVILLTTGIGMGGLTVSGITAHMSMTV